MHSQIEVGTTRAVKYVPAEIAVAIERLCCESRGIEPAKNALLETGGGVANDIRAITPAGVGPGSRVRDVKRETTTAGSSSTRARQRTCLPYRFAGWAQAAAPKTKSAATVVRPRSFELRRISQDPRRRPRT